MQHPRVELIPLTPAPAEVEHVDRLHGWQARIDDTLFPATSFAVEESDGTVFLSLVFPVSALSVGEDPAEDLPVQAEEPKKPSGLPVWGQPAKDPREGIPGWVPEVPGPAVTAPQETRVEFAPSEGEKTLDALQRLIDVKYRGDAGSAFGGPAGVPA